ncbi:hypothetical protein RT41_GL000902 [Lactococcus fujiensis JCM 16395]|uniref:Uncharacterized protein n=2 Tax=Lactococcus fujiensis TaxID=610251 RepID=A0A2A5RIB3_9LACT|nr:hypothetical protein RT41_GL000902 [Lactococcus fujiensis JCM 16395]
MLNFLDWYQKRSVKKDLPKNVNSNEDVIAYYFKNEIKELDENTSPFTVEERLKLEKLFTIIDFNVQQDHNHRPFNFIYDLPIFEKTVYEEGNTFIVQLIPEWLPAPYGDDLDRLALDDNNGAFYEQFYLNHFPESSVTEIESAYQAGDWNWKMTIEEELNNDTYDDLVIEFDRFECQNKEEVIKQIEKEFKEFTILCNQY